MTTQTASAEANVLTELQISILDRAERNPLFKGRLDGPRTGLLSEMPTKRGVLTVRCMLNDGSEMKIRIGLKKVLETKPLTQRAGQKKPTR